MRRLCCLCIMLGCLLLLSAAALADGLIIIEDPLPARIAPPPPYAFTPLEIKYHHVTVTITDQVAVTEVDQVFHNANNQRLEGTYLFPIPRGAQIDSFTMDINGKQTAAELLDADKARSIYEDIVRRMRDPALLEYAGQGMFKVRIFPIEPLSDKQIKLKYTELLREENGIVQYIYPLNTEKFSARPLENVAVRVDITSERGIKSVYSPSHEVDIKRHGVNRAVAGYEAKDIRPDLDFQLIYSYETKDEIGINLMSYRDPGDEGGGYFMLLASPSVSMGNEKIVAKDVVFVLDTSGSMAEGDKIGQAKRALEFCLSNLNPGDRFDVIRFSTEAEPVFGKLVANADDTRTQALAAVRGFKPIGGTAIEDALTVALKPAAEQRAAGRPYMVIFLTDGKPTIGTINADHIIANVKKAMDSKMIRIFCFGIGTDVNAHLLDQLTAETRAASQYVLADEDIELKVSNFYAKINDPVLADIELKVTGDIRLSKMHPSKLPDLFKGEQLVVFGRYAGTGAAAVVLTGQVNGEQRSFTNDAAFTADSQTLAFIPKLWATRRVGFLLDQIRLYGESGELKEEVTLLARQFGIVTPYTAYLIVEDESARAVPAASRTLQGLAADEEAHTETRRMYKQMREEADGAAAVGGAQAFDALKNARAAEAPAAANVYAFKGQTDRAEAGGEKVRQSLTQQQTRHIRGRTFYQNGTIWTDANVQAQSNSKQVQIKFNSDEYFALLNKHPDMPQWLSVGRNVQVVLDGTIFEIIE